MEPGLTLKQIRFIKHYLSNGYDQTKAAAEAGYSRKSAHVAGSRLLKHVKVRAAIKDRMEAMTSADELSIQRKLLEELHSIAFSDVSDFITDGKLDREKIKKAKSGAIKAITKNGFHLHSKDRAIEVLAKHFGFTKDPGTEDNPIHHVHSIDERIDNALHRLDEVKEKCDD